MKKHLITTVPIPEQAAEWLVELAGSEPDECRHRQFMSWLKMSPQHIEEFLAIAVLEQEIEQQPGGVADVLAELSHAGSCAPEPLFAAPGSTAMAAPPASRRKRRVLSWLAVAGVALAALLLTKFSNIDSPVITHTTGLGEQRSVALQDGSILTLNTLSEVDVHIDNSARHVTLHAGEAMFDVVPDRDRPFVVEAGMVSLNVIGTKFSVYRKDDVTRLAVVDGSVQVVPNQPRAEVVVVRGGEGLSVSRNGIIPASPGFDIEKAIAWTERRLVFDGAPLAEVVSEFNRYNPVPIVIEEAELAGRAVTTVFNAHDVSALVAFLELQPDVEVEHDDDAIRIRAKR